MTHGRSLLSFALSVSALLAGAGSAAAQEFEDVNMSTTLDVQDGHLVARWSTAGFDHYNVRWSANGGPARQVERDGDKRFLFVTRFRRGVVYDVSVQGCRSRTLARSQCTTWDAAGCGEAGNLCRTAR